MAEPSPQHKTPTADLAQILNPALLLKLYTLRFPYPPNHTLTRAEVEWTLFNAHSDLASEYYRLCFLPALKPLSLLPLPSLTNLLSHLPPPTTPNFPFLATGVLLLLDQSPRMLLKGTDKRYAGYHFDPLALQLARAFVALPWAQRPDNPARWAELGVGPAASAIARTFLYAPLVHSEDYSDQMLALGLMEAVRRDVEAAFNVMDATRGSDIADARDVAAFARLATLGPPISGPEKDGEDAERLCVPIFWLMRMARVHEPIVRTYGRYPYKNIGMGREDTEEETEFWRVTDNWGKLDEETARRYREDMAAGRWTPLQGDADGGSVGTTGFSTVKGK